MSLRQLPQKVVLITGAGEGIGFETALALAAQKWKVLIADKNNLNQAKNHIIQQTKNDQIFEKHLDLTSLKSIRKLAVDINKSEKRLDVLINNAGIFNSNTRKSQDNLDYVMQVNHFGPFLLTHLLTDLLKNSSPSRIIFVSSVGAFFHYLTPENLNNPPHVPFMSPTLTYYNSKLCNMIASKGFAERLRNFKVTSNCLHPGMTSTGFLFKEMNLLKFVSPLAAGIMKLVTQNVEKSAKMPVFLATDKTVADVTGKYFVNYQTHNEPKILDDQKFCEKIWHKTEILVGIGNNEKLISNKDKNKFVTKTIDISQ